MLVPDADGFELRFSGLDNFSSNAGHDKLNGSNVSLESQGNRSSSSRPGPSSVVKNVSPIAKKSISDLVIKKEKDSGPVVKKMESESVESKQEEKTFGRMATRQSTRAETLAQVIETKPYTIEPPDKSPSQSRMHLRSFDSDGKDTSSLSGTAVGAAASTGIHRNNRRTVEKGRGQRIVDLLQKLIVGRYASCLEMFL